LDSVPPKLSDPLPLVALRDLIGICRALYAAWAASGAGPIELDELMQIGKDLAEAHRLARNTESNTLGHRAAWSRAEEATRRLGHLVGELERAEAHRRDRDETSGRRRESDAARNPRARSEATPAAYSELVLQLSSLQGPAGRPRSG
jgi:hypothetical protein